jgi:hypothetical protein
MAGDAPEGQGDIIPVPPAEQKVRELVRREAFGMFQFGPAPNPLVEKMTEEHITKVIDNSEADNKRSDYRIKFLAVILTIGFIAICGMFLYAGQSALLKEILTLFITFAGGFAGGYGFKAYKGSH